MGSEPAPSNAQPLRLAILECDTPFPNTDAHYHGYAGVFADLFARANPSPVTATIQISSYNVVDAKGLETYPLLSAVDAVLLSGSKHSAYDSTPWIALLVDYVRAVLDTNRVRVVGVCFGHQIVGRALGVPITGNEKGWEVSVTEVRLTEKGREVFGEKTMKIHQMHRDIVTDVPEGAELLAENEFCGVQGFLLPRKCITVQGHPEFTEDIAREILEGRRSSGVISEDLYRNGMARVADKHDGVRIAQAFLNFLQQ